MIIYQCLSRNNFCIERNELWVEWEMPLKGDSAREENFNEESEAKIYEHVHSLIFHSQQGCSHLDGKDYHQGAWCEEANFLIANKMITSNAITSLDSFNNTLILALFVKLIASERVEEFFKAPNLSAGNKRFIKLLPYINKIFNIINKFIFEPSSLPLNIN